MVYMTCQHIRGIQPTEDLALRLVAKSEAENRWMKEHRKPRVRVVHYPAASSDRRTDRVIGGAER